jgi:tRNA-splicing ligase RtcB
MQPAEHAQLPLRRVGDVLWELGCDYRPDMHVPVRIIADEELLAQIVRDRSVEQLVNVSTLPGVTQFAVAMPDMHEGYGFPVGGVAATRAPDGVISPGGIGFDINCGVRLLVSSFQARELGDVTPLVHELSRSIPTGYGRHGRFALDSGEMERVMEEGAPWLVREREFGLPEDLAVAESGGALPGADSSAVSERAQERGGDQLGTLGGGNHFLEVQRVEKIYDLAAASALGIFPDQLTVLIHTGSRGLGHQICTDYVRLMDAALARHRIALPDRQLACAPLSSPEGKAYLAAMAAAANFAWCNRQMLTHRVREVFARVLGSRLDAGLRVLSDVAHNIAKMERAAHGVTLCVHRKGATRAFGPSNPELPQAFRGVGQPVLIPGSMGTASFILVGADASAEISLSSSCHGAGRAMSRGAAKREVVGHVLRKQLEELGIVVRCPSNAELAEEAPVAYKDVDRVVDVVSRAGIAKKVARLVPLGVLKG